MTCVHKVKWSVKRPEDCRFRLSVSHYKDRIVAPDEYSGATVVTPSDEIQVLETKDKTVRSNITVNSAPTETLATNENGTFTPSSGNVGFSEVTVDVEPVLETLSCTENGLYLPESGTDGFDRVSVNVPQPSGSTEITQNGTYDVTQYASAVVDVYGQYPSYDDVVLPAEYQRVEYIESSGNQFINLPYGFDATDVISMRSAIDTSMGRDKFMVCPTRWNNNSNRFGLCGTAVSKTLIFAYGAESTNDTIFRQNYLNDGLNHDYYYGGLIFMMVDLKRSCGVGGATFGAETYPLRLFYGYNANTIGKIAYFVHTKADGRKIALFACYRKADGVIGMYDIENDVFYTNDGTGDFAKGQDI